MAEFHDIESSQFQEKAQLEGDEKIQISSTEYTRLQSIANLFKIPDNIPTIDVVRSEIGNQVSTHDISDTAHKAIRDILKPNSTLPEIQEDLNALGDNYNGLYALASTLKFFLEAKDTADSTINTWKDIEDFLNGLTDRETLTGLMQQEHQKLTDEFNNKISTLEGKTVNTTTQISAGDGLVGGGPLSTDVTLSMARVMTAGTFTKVQVDVFGRVILGMALAAGDIPNLPWSKITSGKPTTLGGYGITDAVTVDTEQTVSGRKVFTNICLNGQPENPNMPFFLGIDDYASGGAVKYITANKVANAIGVYTKTEADGKFLTQHQPLDHLYKMRGFSGSAVDWNDLSYRLGAWTIVPNSFGANSPQNTYPYGLLVCLGTGPKVQLYFPHGNPQNIQIRISFDGSDGQWSSWRKLAFLDDTVAAATAADMVDGKHVSVLTASQYNSTSKDANTIYFVTD